MTTTKIKIPALRFPEFEGEWEEKKLGEILSFGNGRDYKHLNEGDIPVYGTGGYMTSVNDFLYDGETICIGRKGSINKPMYFNGKIWTVDTLFYTFNFKSAVPLFIYNIFQNVNWLKYNEASGVPSLSKGTIEKIKISFPSLPEQQKIADFLSAVDKRLQLLKDKNENLETYKRGVMQRIFSQELRFTRLDGSAYPDWEEKRIGDVFTFRQGVQCPVEEQSLERNEDSVRFIRIIDLTSSNEPARYIRTFNQKDIIKSNDLFMVRYGTPGLVGYGFEGVVANNLFRLIPVTDVYNKYYYYVLLFLNKKITSLASSSTMPALNFKSLGMLEIPEPHIDEQRQIADFLSAIDDKISLLNQQIQSTEQYKKGLLQQMFV